MLEDTISAELVIDKVPPLSTTNNPDLEYVL